jgi:hypothetical protein
MKKTTKEKKMAEPTEDITVIIKAKHTPIRCKDFQPEFGWQKCPHLLVHAPSLSSSCVSCDLPNRGGCSYYTTTFIEVSSMEKRLLYISEKIDKLIKDYYDTKSKVEDAVSSAVRRIEAVAKQYEIPVLERRVARLEEATQGIGQVNELYDVLSSHFYRDED